MGSRVSRLDRVRMHHPNTRTYTYNKLKPKGTPDASTCSSLFAIVYVYSFTSCGYEVECGIVADNSLVDAGITPIKGTLVY